MAERRPPSRREEPICRLGARAGGAALLVVVALVAAACGDDDDAATGTGVTCAATVDVDDAVDALAATDVMQSDQAELAAALDEVRSAISALAVEDDVDATDILGDIDDAVAELPSELDLDDQLTLNGVRDTRDIVVADVRTWMDEVAPGCS